MAPREMPSTRGTTTEVGDGEPFALVPLVERISATVSTATPDMVEAGRLQGLEDRLGGVNLLLAILSLVLAVWRPGEGRQRAVEAHSGGQHPPVSSVS